MQPDEIIRLKHRQHKQDMARIRDLERQLSAVTADRDQWLAVVRAGAELRQTVMSALKQVLDERESYSERRDWEWRELMQRRQRSPLSRL